MKRVCSGKVSVRRNESAWAISDGESGASLPNVEGFDAGARDDARSLMVDQVADLTANIDGGSSRDGSLKRVAKFSSDDSGSSDDEARVSSPMRLAKSSLALRISERR